MVQARLVRCCEILQLIKRLEKFIPHSLQAFYLATAIQKNRWRGIDFFVDSWPNFSAVVAKPSLLNVSKPFCNLTKNEHSVFHVDIEKLRSLLLSPGLVDWSQNITWSAMKLKDEVEVLEDCAQRHGGCLEVDSMQELYVIDVGEVALQHHCRVPPEMYCTALEPHNAEMVATDWQVHRHHHNMEFVHKLIQHFPTTCLKRRTGPEPGTADDVVAYALMYHFGSYGMAFVKPQYRGNQYFSTVTANLIKYSKERGFMPHPFGFVPKENVAASKQSAQFGGSVIRDADVAWCFYRRPGSAGDSLTAATTAATAATAHCRHHRHPHDEHIWQELAK